MTEATDAPERQVRSGRPARADAAHRSSGSSDGNQGSSARSARPSSSGTRAEGKPRQNPYATLRALKWLTGLALVLSASCLVTIAVAVSNAGAGPAASPGDLQTASACAKAKLVGEYVRLKMTAGLRGTRPLRRSDVTAAERSCESDVATDDVNILIEQANALNVPGLAPAAQAPAPQPSQAQQ